MDRDLFLLLSREKMNIKQNAIVILIEHLNVNS